MNHANYTNFKVEKDDYIICLNPHLVKEKIRSWFKFGRYFIKYSIKVVNSTWELIFEVPKWYLTEIVHSDDGRWNMFIVNDNGKLVYYQTWVWKVSVFAHRFNG